MTITAKVVAHSRADGAPDLITVQARYPRFIHAEVMTHRVFSRNASSSRAIPTERLLREAMEDCAMPVEWHYNRGGMQGTTLMSEADANEAQLLWYEARDAAVATARRMMQTVNPHKQVINRLLEPFTHISVVITATEWQNFFDLRCHPDADPTMRKLAEAVRDAINASKASEIDIGGEQWHLPYISVGEMIAIQDTGKIAMISAARCARVSYLTHDGQNPDIEKDLALAKKLLDSKHMSPSEHQAIASPGTRSANFVGWRQHRQMLEHE